MGIVQCWKKSRHPIARVNNTPCRTEKDLQHSLKKVFCKKQILVEIEIYELAAQRILLPLAVYSPRDLLPPKVGELVNNISREAPSGKVLMGHDLAISLATANIMQTSTNQLVRVTCAAIHSALGQGYGTISFGTTQTSSSQSESSGAVLIRINL